MDFFNDQILTDLDRADYVGGIDNEAIFFEDLQVTTGIGRLGGTVTPPNITSNAGNVAGDHPSALACSAKTETPVTSPMSGVAPLGADIVLPSIPSVSARVSLQATPHIGIHSHNNNSNNNNNSSNSSSSSNTHTHLPESPPDSGSEPPYSPLQDVQGLTLGSRDIFHHNIGSGTNLGNPSASPLSDLNITGGHHRQHVHLQQQQQQLHDNSQHYVHLQENPSMRLNSMTSPGHDPNLNSIRVKHERGLIINPNSLGQTLNTQSLHHSQQQQQQQQQHHHQNHNNHHAHHGHTHAHAHVHAHPHLSDTHIEIPGPQAQLQQYSHNNNNNHNSPMTYDSLANKLYGGGTNNNQNNLGNPPGPPPPSYQISLAHMDLQQVDSSPTCMLTSIGDLPHVQVVGTSHASLPSTPTLSRASAPSTPNHQSSSRKRKMTTQIDCPDFPCVKPDPGLMMSPSRSSMCGTPLPMEVGKRSSISPLNIQVSSHDIADTPAHSTASLSPALSSVNMDSNNGCHSGVGTGGSQKSNDGSTNGSTGGASDALSPCIHFTPFQPQNWHELADQNLQEVKVSFYRVDADKGFNFSVSDDAFVCQKKNHFQITCHARLQNEAKFVKTPSGLEKIKSFHLHFYGVKLEAPNQTIRIEQSQSDRSKKPFYPVPIDLQSHIVSKVTVGRLHFSETTNNNMRKKGRPNPEQRYFQLVVGLHVHTASGDYPIVAQGSDKIIVRASNPGQFESDVDLCWQRGLTQDSIFHAGRVGINTDRPDESLVVHGNLKISGHIVQPSDSRAKQEIGELDTSVQLRNLQKIRIVRYRLEPQFALHSGLKSHRDEEDIVDTGVIAQEVREVIPDAVQEAGSVVLPNGNVIENFLLVNKDRILMENIGAVKELCNITGTLETRIENLERVNHRLQRVKENDLQFMQCKNLSAAGRSNSRDGYEICSNRTLQIIIFLLVIVMAACLAAVSTLYFVEHNKKQHNFKHLESIQLLSSNGLTLMEQERIYLQQLLKSNRSHTGATMALPSLTYHSSSSSSSSLATAGGLARSHNQNGSLPLFRGGEGLSFGGEFSYFDPQEELAVPPTSQQLGRNDEITVVMEKPSVVNHELLQPYRDHLARTTTSPVVPRVNKTVNSKHKHKWPQPQMVLRVMQAATSRNSLPATRDLEGATNSNDESNNSNNGGHKNASESSTEKISDVILVQQDFENNSIDTDSQQTVDNGRTKTSSNSKKRLPSISAEGGEVGGHSEIQQLNLDSGQVASTSRSINENGLRELSPPTQSNVLRHSNNRGGDFIIYKTVPPPTSSATTTTTAAASAAVAAAAAAVVGAQTHHTTTANNKLNTDAPHTNYSLESQPISNKSRNYVERNPDNSDNDLQSLTSNTNESIFNSGDPVDYDLENRQSRRTSGTSLINGNGPPSGHNVWVQSSTIFVDTFGEPEQCNNKVKREDISNCQSVCFEENNQLLAPNQPTYSLKPSETKKPLSLQQQEEIDNENHSESEDNDAVLREPDDDLQAAYGNIPLLNGKIVKDNNGSASSSSSSSSSLLTGNGGQGKTSHSTKALAKQLNDEDDHQQEQQHEQQQQQSESEGINFDAILEHNFSDDDNLDTDVGKIKKVEKTEGLLGQPNLSVEPNRPPLEADCWKIRSCILAERMNNTFAFDDYCPKMGKSMNLTYVIPLSRFFKEQSIELHLTSSLPLQWVLCNIHEHSKINGIHLINSSNPSLSTINGGHQSQNVLQRRRNTSLLLLNVPSRGYFVKDLILRATSDPEKSNVCQEMPHDSNTILQYNFRILRDCD